MSTERFFFNIDTSFRLMKAREAFFLVLLKTGIVTAAISATMAFLAVPYIQAVTSVCVIISTGIAAFFAGRIYFQPRAYEPPLYYDRAVDGGERFPALCELIEEKRQGWVRDVLEQECGEIIAKRIRGVFPFFRGRGKYFFLPYIIVFVILALPGVKTGAGRENVSEKDLLITEKIKTENGIFANEHIPQDRVPNAEQPAKLGNRTKEEMDKIKNLLNNPNIRRLVEDMIERGFVTKETWDKIKPDILAGNKGIEDLLDWIEGVMGGSGTGPGAGKIDAVRNALAEDDFARAAAEFKLFLKFLETRDAKTIILRMKGRVEEYKPRSVVKGRNGDNTLHNGSTDIMPFPHVKYTGIPFQYRETVSRYFELNK
ncbi:hypothetical protein ACFL6F_02670 [Planctomycetota bacterium]